jgi:hypothetical protein
MFILLHLEMGESSTIFQNKIQQKVLQNFLFWELRIFVQSISSISTTIGLGGVAAADTKTAANPLHLPFKHFQNHFDTYKEHGGWLLQWDVSSRK